MWSGPHMLNFKLLLQLYHKETSDRELKQHIWEDKEDCSRSEVPYVTLIIWMTVATTQNEAQLFHLSVTIFWHNPTAPRCTCLILARFLQLSWQKLGSWIILAVALVTMQMLCHWPNNNNNVQEYTDSIFWWPVTIVTIDAKCSSQTLMTINQTWWCHKPSQCRDPLSIHIAIQITSLRIICT